MKKVSLSEAQTGITELLKDVERGETVQISPDGPASAQSALVFDESRREDARQAMRELLELRKKNGRATVEEILEWRDEGRK
jgi:antitoxin (DNA-binding transcriptional repressor) of toxin-antitoxin stability system